MKSPPPARRKPRNFDVVAGAARAAILACGLAACSAPPGGSPTGTPASDPPAGMPARAGDGTSPSGGNVSPAADAGSADASSGTPAAACSVAAQSDFTFNLGQPSHGQPIGCQDFVEIDTAKTSSCTCSVGVESCNATIRCTCTGPAQSSSKYTVSLDVSGTSAVGTATVLQSNNDGDTTCTYDNVTGRPDA